MPAATSSATSAGIHQREPPPRAGRVVAAVAGAGRSIHVSPASSCSARAQVADELRRRRIAIARAPSRARARRPGRTWPARRGSPRAPTGSEPFTWAAASAVGESAWNGRLPASSSHATIAERVAVARRACPLAPRLLRRQVPGRAEDRPGLRERVHAGRARDPEVGDLNVPAAVEDQVARLDVAMDDAGLVRRVERGGRVVEPVEHLRRRARACVARSSRLPPERYSMTISGRPLCSSTSKIVTMLGLPERRAAASASRLNRCRSAVVLRVALCQHLDRDVAAELLVGGAEDLAHAAAPDVFGVAVAGRKGVGRNGHARLGNRWGSAFDGMETFGKSWPWLSRGSATVPRMPADGRGRFALRLGVVCLLLAAGGVSSLLAAGPRALRATTVTTATVVTSPAASVLVLRGHGWGHGLGLSQWGAYGYAKHGWTYDRILAHYYTGTTLGPAKVDDRPCAARRRQEGDARLGRRLDRDRRRRVARWRSPQARSS